MSAAFFSRSLRASPTSQVDQGTQFSEQPNILSVACWVLPWWPFPQRLMQARARSLQGPLVWNCEMHRLLHFMSPTGHFARQAASPRRSLSEIVGSWPFAMVIVIAAVMTKTDKNIAILWKSNIAGSFCDQGACSVHLQRDHHLHANTTPITGEFSVIAGLAVARVSQPRSFPRGPARSHSRVGKFCSQPDRNLSVLAQHRFLSSQFWLGKLEGR